MIIVFSTCVASAVLCALKEMLEKCVQRGVSQEKALVATRLYF